MSGENKELPISIHMVNWQNNKIALAKIRYKVFIEEQNVPEEMEWDEYDNISTHFLVTLDTDQNNDAGDDTSDHPKYNSGNTAIATARLKPDGQLGRMAVLAAFRGNGIGSRLLRFILRTVDEKQKTSIYLHAQVTAISFYQKHGFLAQGEVFFEAGIAHRVMRLKTQAERKHDV